MAVTGEPRIRPSRTWVPSSAQAKRLRTYSLPEEQIKGSVFVKTFINHTELFKLPQAPKQERIMTLRKAK